jgi:hypothetical protein
MLALVFCASVALGQDSRGGRGGRGRNRGGDRSSADGSSRGASRNESFLRRLDANGNGMIDSEEVTGGYKSIVEGVLTKLGIELKYPISLNKVAKAARKADRRAASSDASDSGDGSSSSDDTSAAADSHKAPPANGFAAPKPSQPIVPGFGQASVPVSGETKTAAPSASSSASPSSPEKTATIAPATAKAGGASAEHASASSDAPSDSPKRIGPKSGRFLTPKERLAKGLPDWFAEKDADGDGQVSMAEYAGEWTPEAVAEFNRFDLNHDGIVTAAECLRATEGPRSKSK